MTGHRVTIIAVALLAVVWLAMMLGGAGLLDRAVLDTLYVGGHQQLGALMRGITLLGNWPAVVGISVIAAVWLLLTRHARNALLLLGISLTGRGLVELQKFGVHRPRPDELAHLVPVNSFSFPSAHAANSMMLWLSLALLLPRREWRPAAVGAALLVTFLVGISRPMLGVHWPSDVIGGWSFGAAWVLAMIALAERWTGQEETAPKR